MTAAGERHYITQGPTIKVCLLFLFFFVTIVYTDKLLYFVIDETEKKLTNREKNSLTIVRRGGKANCIVIFGRDYSSRRNFIGRGKIVYYYVIV